MSIKITTVQSPVRIKVHSSEHVAVVGLLSQPGGRGPIGPRGPDPWLDPIQEVDASGAFAIDYALGKHVRLNLRGNASLVAVSNWPAMDRIARLTLEILNFGEFGLTGWPDGTIWQSGIEPSITSGSGKRDRIILSTTDSGATIYGDIVGADYQSST